MAKPVHIGCAGWNYRDWRGPIYPEGLPARRWLERYAELFDTVEINNTFYRLPSKSAVEGWVEQTPRGFVFAVKASRYLTHVKRLREMRRGAAPLLRGHRAARQVAASWARSSGSCPRTSSATTIAWERRWRRCPRAAIASSFAIPSWFVPEVYDLLRRHRAALVIGDDPERPFQSHEITAGWTYIRFHRGNRGRRGNYSERELEQWKRRIASWRAEVEVFAYFNNDWEAFAPRNALWLAERLSR